MTVPESLIALWAGQPEADLRADIAEIIVMQHGMPVAGSGT